MTCWMHIKYPCSQKQTCNLLEPLQKKFRSTISHNSILVIVFCDIDFYYNYYKCFSLPISNFLTFFYQTLHSMCRLRHFSHSIHAFWREMVLGSSFILQLQRIYLMEKFCLIIWLIISGEKKWLETKNVS